MSFSRAGNWLLVGCTVARTNETTVSHPKNSCPFDEVKTKLIDLLPAPGQRQKRMFLTLKELGDAFCDRDGTPIPHEKRRGTKLARLGPGVGNVTRAR